MRPEQSQGKHAHPSGLPGTLFIVGVSIGHPDDLTIRALATLRQVGLVATKNPRITQALLAHHGIRTTLTTYDRANAADKTPILLARLMQGTHVALVSDCGMPLVYDPGRLLINAAAASQISIEVIPGPSAVVAAVALAGMDSNAFIFEGRWSGETRTIIRRLDSLKAESRTMILFPPRLGIRKMLTLLVNVLGNRRIVAAADLTHETQRVVRGRVREILTHYPFDDEMKQVTLIVEGRRTGKGKPRIV